MMSHLALQGTHHLRRLSARISAVRSVSARPRPLPGLWGQGQLSSTRCRWAGRDGDAEHLGDGGVVEAVLHLGDGPHHAMLGGSRVGGWLKRCLVPPQPWLLVDLRARIPKQNLRGDVAADWLAAGVEQGDAFLPRM